MSRLHNFFLSQGASVITGNDSVLKILSNIEEVKEIHAAQSNKNFAINILVSSRDRLIDDLGQVAHNIRKLHLSPEIFLLKKNLHIHNEILNVYLIINTKSVPFFQYYLSCVSFFIAMLMESEGFFCVHGGYLSNKLGGFLITGKTGSGKSTLLFKLARFEPSFITDRYALIYELNSSVRLMSVFEIIDRFGLVKIGKLISVDKKKMSVLDRNFSRHEREAVLPDTYALDFIIFPQISGKYDNAIKEVSRAAALKRLIAFSSAAVNSSDKDIKARQLLLLNRLSRQCRAFVFSGGREIIESPSCGSYALLKRAIEGNN